MFGKPPHSWQNMASVVGSNVDVDVDVAIMLVQSAAAGEDEEFEKTV